MDEDGLERVTVAARTFETLLSRMREVAILREQFHRAENADLKRCTRAYWSAGVINNHLQNSLQTNDVIRMAKLSEAQRRKKQTDSIAH